MERMDGGDPWLAGSPFEVEREKEALDSARLELVRKSLEFGKAWGFSLAVSIRLDPLYPCFSFSCSMSSTWISRMERMEGGKRRSVLIESIPS